MDGIFSQFVQEADISKLPISVLLPRLLVALAIGVGLAARPWRLLMRKPLPRMEMMQAQILLCSAAAIITIVIGNSVAKAFGLVGLGSFVRFRSGLKDPRDAANLFLLIGLGMACGHGSVAMAVVAAAFVAVLLAALDLFTTPVAADADGDLRAATEAASTPPQPVAGAGLPAAPAPLPPAQPVNGAPNRAAH